MNSIKKGYDNQSGNNIENIDPNSNTIKSNEKVISTKSNIMKNFDPISSIKKIKRLLLLNLIKSIWKMMIPIF